MCQTLSMQNICALRQRRVWLAQTNGLLEAKVEMMRDNLNAARADASAKAALEREVSSLKEQLVAQSSPSNSKEHAAALERPASSEEGRQLARSTADLEKEVESLQQTNKLLTDQIRSLQVSAWTGVLLLSPVHRSHKNELMPQWHIPQSPSRLAVGHCRQRRMQLGRKQRL